MEVLHGEEVTIQENTAVALGSFDGIHVGHQFLIKTLVEKSKKNKLSSVVFTFSNHPSEVLDNKETVQKLTTNEKKEEIIQSLGVDFLYFRPFTQEFLHLNPREFIEKVLIQQMRAKLIIVGFNFRFGHKGLGNTDTLKMYSQEYGYKVDIVSPIKNRDYFVSSTEIRKNLGLGKVDLAAESLGRPYSLKSIIIQGKQIGRTIGFPTINLQIKKEFLIPSRGVYITQTLIKGKKYRSATNIGYNPTFDGNYMTIETFILDFDETVYGEVAEVFFLKRIRGEQKFNSVEDLIHQMQEDVTTAKKYFENNIDDRIT